MKNKKYQDREMPEINQYFSNDEFRESMHSIANWLARKFDLKLYVNLRIVDECYVLAKHTLESFRQPKFPSAGKVAGVHCYWVKTLKPLALREDSPKENLVINELCAILLGLATLQISAKINTDFIRDFAGSLRIHAHSLHSISFIFEILEGRADMNYRLESHNSK